MTLNWSYKSGGVTGSDITNSQNLIISEINENDPIPYISNILNDTCPPNYNHKITIYGQNFRPDSTVNIPGASNILTTVVSPTEIIAQFTSGAIIGAFDIEVKNSDHSSILWGQSNKLNIISVTGGNLPLLDTWIDCRYGGSSDGMIGAIKKDSFTTWSRGIFGYTITGLSSAADNWSFYFRLLDYSFPINLPLKMEYIFYTSGTVGNIRWGLHPENDQNINAPLGFNRVPHPSLCRFSYYSLSGSKELFYAGYQPPATTISSYTKIIISSNRIAFFNTNPSDFATEANLAEYFVPDPVVASLTAELGTKWEPGAKFTPTGGNLLNTIHLTAFKLSWA